MQDLTGKIALITGSNSGIGLETARGLARAGATVVMAARNLDKGNTAVADIRATTGSDKVELLQLDLASLESVRKAAAEFLGKHDALHLLVNNAGIMTTRQEKTRDGFEATMGVNHLGHFLLTQLLVDRMKASAPARIINVSSMGHMMTPGLKVDDLFYEKRRYVGLVAYADSKLANVLFTTELARRLEGTGVVVHALHPGMVRTGLGGNGQVPSFAKKIWDVIPFVLNAEQGAATSLHVATSDEAGLLSGKYWSNSKVRRPRLPRNEPEVAQRLWDVSARLVAA